MANINCPNSIAITGIRKIDENICKFGKEAIFVNEYHALYLPLMKDTEDRYRSLLDSMGISQQPCGNLFVSMMNG